MMLMTFQILKNHKTMFLWVAIAKHQATPEMSALIQRKIIPQKREIGKKENE